MSEGDEAREDQLMADAEELATMDSRQSARDRLRGAVRGAFDPVPFLTEISGKDYLEVKWRLLWLRETHPDADLRTELVKLEGGPKDPNGWALFKATVSIPGGGAATGYGSEDKGGFGDFIEKAETKAIGRALGALGFGTQFSREYEFGADQGRVVDAPVERTRTNAPSTKGSTPAKSGNASGAAAQGQDRAPGVNPANADAAPTDKQLSTLEKQFGAHKIDADDAAAGVYGMFGKKRADLTRQDVSDLIGRFVDSKLGEVQWFLEFADTAKALRAKILADKDPGAAKAPAAPASKGQPEGFEPWTDAFDVLWLANVNKASTPKALEAINETIVTRFGYLPDSIGQAIDAKEASLKTAAY